jgi:hypothetical protein
MPIIGFHTADGQNAPPKLLQEGGPVKRYDVEINGVKTTLQLTDEDAKSRGLTKSSDDAKPEEAKQAKAPANKSRSAASK